MSAIPANDSDRDLSAMSETLIELHQHGRRLVRQQVPGMHPADLATSLPTVINGFAAEGALLIAGCITAPESDAYFDAWDAGLDLVIAHLQATKLSVEAIRRLPRPPAKSTP